MSRMLPPLLLGMILAIYWGRVLRMARKARQKTGRAANIVPAERVGRAIRMVWFPIVAIWIVVPFITAFARSLPAAIRPFFYNVWIACVALMIAGIALYLTFRCWRAMGRHWRMGIDPAEQNTLLASGPFAYARHPIYALSALLMLMTMIMLPSPLMLIVGVIHIGLLMWESHREEKHMLQVHGEAYAAYCRQVGAFFPRLSNNK